MFDRLRAGDPEDKGESSEKRGSKVDRSAHQGKFMMP